ncbi:hypothetical protein ACFE04_024709 [Oxalis oulophora]
MTCFSFLHKRVNSGRQNSQLDEVLPALNHVKLYTYKELKNATQDFNPINKIGEGGFGPVYKGRLKNGKLAAIKVLSAHSKQGVGEFLTEINVITEIEHENLVKLYGCCVEQNNRIVVYNYLEKNSLSQTLLGSNRSDIQFSWETRGYLAPEYAVRGQLTRKADIYSFGVLLTEVVCGRCNTNTRLPQEEHYLLERTWQFYERKELVLLVDPTLSGNFDAEEACRFLKIALLCTQDSPKLRPSMSTVVMMLSGKKSVDEISITKPGLISDFMDMKVRSNSESETGFKVTSYASSSSGTQDNSTMSFGISTNPTTTTFLARYDESF